MSGVWSAVELAVWRAVRLGDRSGTALSPMVVAARTGVRVDGPAMNAAVERLVAAGHLRWRSPRIRRRLLAGIPPVTTEPAPDPGWTQDTLINDGRADG